MSELTVASVCRRQELCGEAPRVPHQEFGAGERPADPDEDGKRNRGGRGGGGGKRRWNQWGRQPLQVRSMKQVCVLVFVSVGVCVCKQGSLFHIFIYLHSSFILRGLVLCLFPLCSHVCVCRALIQPNVWPVFPSFHTVLSSTKPSGFPTTECSLQKSFPSSVVQRCCPRTQQARRRPLAVKPHVRSADRGNENV